MTMAALKSIKQTEMREAARQRLDACSVGMQAVQEIVGDLEKDNKMFGMYLENASAKLSSKSKNTDKEVMISLDACSRAKTEARRRVEDIRLQGPALKEVSQVCAEFEPRRPEAKRKEYIRPCVHISESLYSHSIRQEVRPPESPKFQARPLPEDIYGKELKQEGNVAKRTVDWYHQKEEARNAIREQRKQAALQVLRPVPNLAESTKSWQNAKQEAALTAEFRAAQEAKRHKIISTRKALKLARQANALKTLQAETKRLKQQVRSQAIRPDPRPEAPVTRTTAAFRSKANIEAENTVPKEPQPPPKAESSINHDDPFSTIAPFRLDPRVLAIMGEDFVDDIPTPQQSSTFSDRVKYHERNQHSTRHARRHQSSPPRTMTSPSSAPDLSRLPPSFSQQLQQARNHEQLPPTQPSPSCAFFDALSSKERGRKQVNDARLFQPTSMRRDTLEQGIVLLKGITVEEPHTELVICVLFDRHRFSEKQAEEWWDLRGRELCGVSE